MTDPSTSLGPDPGPRLAVRAVILHRDRLLLVNAWPDNRSDLWCLPGGGVELHSSLPDNLIREVYEETGLTVTVGDPVMVNEFHDPGGTFHQVDLYFRCHVANDTLDDGWRDPLGVVNRRCWVTRAEMAVLRFKPDSLPQIAWGKQGTILYDPLEPILR